VFTPLNVSTPAPAFVNENAPPNAPDITTPLAAVIVVFAANVPAPLIVNTPVFAASPNVTAPFNVYPFVTVRAVVPSLDNAPPFITSAPVPSAPAFPTDTFPAFTVTPPVNVFAALNVNAPVPSFTKEPPAPLTTTPTLDAVLPPMVSTFPCTFTVPLPLAVNTPTVSLDPNFKLPLVANATVVPSPIALPPLNVNVPPFTVVFPVNVFAPPSVNSPAPCFVKLADPPKTPPNTTPLATVNVVAAVTVPAPPNVNTPLFVASPNVTVPPNEIPFTNVRAVVPSLDTPPPLTTNVPPPNAPSPPKYKAPALTVVPPP
jgi:hypothetical protein